MRKIDGTILGSMKYRTNKAGGLGFVYGGCVAADGSWEMCWTDVGGTYRRDAGETEWIQTTDYAHMGQANMEATRDARGTYGEGGCGASICGADSNVAYKVEAGILWKTVNKGRNWTPTTMTGIQLFSNGRLKNVMNKVACDPTNPLVCYVADPVIGLRVTYDGGETETTLMDIPLPNGGTDWDHISVCIDQSSSLTSGRHSRVYAFVENRGIYMTENGFASVTTLSTLRKNAWNMFIAPSGKLWFCDRLLESNGVFSRPTGGSWTTHTIGYCPHLAIDPANENNMYFQGPCKSTDGGATISGIWQPPWTQCIVQNVPTVAQVINEDAAAGAGAATANALFHADGTVRLYMGLGVLNIDWAAWEDFDYEGVKLDYIEDAEGMETLVPQFCLWPPNGKPLLVSQDRAAILSDDPDVYPAKVGITHWLNQGDHADWCADDPSTIVIACKQSNGLYINMDGKSTNGGRDFTPFATQADPTYSGGCIVAGNVGNYIRCPGMNRWPRYTLDDGDTWADCVFTGITRPADGTDTGWGFANYTIPKWIIAADKQNPGTFYAYNYGPSSPDPTFNAAIKGVWKSVNGGALWVRVFADSPIGIHGGFHTHLQCVEGILWLCAGTVSGYWDDTPDLFISRSMNGGVSWAKCFDTVAETRIGVSEPHRLGFGAPAPGKTYPTAYMVGFKSGVFGMWRSIDADEDVPTTQNAGDPEFIGVPRVVVGNPDKFGEIIYGDSSFGFKRGILTHDIVAS